MFRDFSRGISWLSRNDRVAPRISMDRVPMFARSRSLRFAHPPPRHPPNSHKSTGWVSISLITDKVVVVVARNIVSNLSEATEVNSTEKVNRETSNSGLDPKVSGKIRELCSGEERQQS